MSEILVCGKWPLKLLEGKAGGYFQWRDTVASRRNSECLLELVTGLPEGMSVAEHFGGVGEASTVFQNVLKPRSHWVSDIDDDCVLQLRTNLPPGITVVKGDAKETMGTVEAEFISLDFAYYTAKYHDDYPWQKVFDQKPKYVEFADGVKRRIGLHRHIYSALFGEDVWDYADYTAAYSRYMSRRHGYHITKTVSRT